MTDRVGTLLVALEHDLRVDDAESLINAIKCMRGVVSVVPADGGADTSTERAVELLTGVLLAHLRTYRAGGRS